MSKHTVLATPIGSFWKIVDSDNPELTSIVQNLSSVRRTFTKLIADLEGISDKDVELVIDVELSDDLRARRSEVDEALAEAKRAKDYAHELQASLARDLVGAGMSQRDTASALGVTQPFVNEALKEVRSSSSEALENPNTDN